MNFLFKLSLIPSSVLGTVLIYKTYFGVPKYNDDKTITGKVAIVTGASSGIGQEIAYKLAIRDATVIMGCRNLNDCKLKRMKIVNKSKNDKVYCSELDLESYQSIHDFGRRIKEKFKTIDILVHNAGYKSGDKREISCEFTEKQLAVNALGPYLITKELMPLLQLSDAARVLFMVCPQYASGDINVENINQENYNKDKAFSQSQLMKMLIMKHFAANAALTNVTFNACDPGPTYSNFHRNANYNNNFISRWIFRYLNLLVLRNMWQAVETPIMCCVSDEVGLCTGSLFRDLEKQEIDPKAEDEKLAEYVHNLCHKWTNKTHKNQNFLNKAM